MTQVMGYSKPRKRFNMHCSTIKMFLFEEFLLVCLKNALNSLFVEMTHKRRHLMTSRDQIMYDNESEVWTS